MFMFNSPYRSTANGAVLVSNLNTFALSEFFTLSEFSCRAGKHDIFLVRFCLLTWLEREIRRFELAHDALILQGGN